MTINRWLVIACMILPALAAHGQTPTTGICSAANQSDSAKELSAALTRDPTQLESRLKLADELMDQGCFDAAVSVLEAGQASHPRSADLARKLREVRSMVSEQRYIEGLSQAAAGAKARRNLFRCTKLADLDACNEALKEAPNDPAVLAARAAASGSQKSGAASADSTPMVESPAPPPSSAPAVVAASQRPVSLANPKPSAPSSASPRRARSDVTTRPNAAPVANAAPTFSNHAPEGRSN
jgi:hypothetical protein